MSEQRRNSRLLARRQQSSARRLSVWLALLSASFGPARAQERVPAPQGTPTPADVKDATRLAPPPYSLLRQDEDYRYLRNTTKHRDWADNLKYIPLNAKGDQYLTLGGEVRERFEYFNHPLWGQARQDDGYLLQRYMFHADLHLGPRLRFFYQLKSGLVTGNKNPPHPPDEDELDTHQFFGDFTFLQRPKEELTLRVGRQELAFGSNRLVTVREGPNVRQSFDGVRAWYTRGPWRFDAFTTRPVTTSRSVFDDGPDPGKAFWGVYATGPLPVLPGGKIDLYYLGLDRNKAHFDEGTERETRHSIGTRLWGGRGAWDYNAEFVYQFGRFGPGAISAWTAATDIGYTIAKAGWKPRLGLKADIASGNQNPNGKNLNTFDPLFPSGKYFNEAGLGAPANFFDVYPYVETHPSSRLTWTNGWDFLWRESLYDGIYTYSTDLIRSGRNSRARYIGSQLTSQADWQIERHLSFSMAYVHFFAGDFIKQSGPGKDVDYVSTWATYKF